jgi:hypothetical protein
VTDGIYRQPGSALRELISNAYDADATRVTIQTDRPRFDRMVIEDDGRGMSLDALAYLLYNIGGSAKRTSIGKALGVTNADDPNYSPGGRPLIGKIGIGLFSVAQLTQGFQIITKIAGDDKRSVASVVLRQYSEQIQDSPDAEYEAGKVLVWHESASDLQAHGTTIVLNAIRPQTRETLRSVNIWDAVYGAGADDGAAPTNIPAPRYHIGSVQPAANDLLRQEKGHYRLPWSNDDTPHEAFTKLVNSVWNAVNEGVPNPRLEQFFDYYLQMVWDLSLWCPLPYFDVHPFDLTGADGITIFELGPGQREREIELPPDKSIRMAAQPSSLASSPTNFSVTIDDLALRRPVKLRHLPTTSAAVKTPVLFFASELFPFTGIDLELSGGPLSFDAYILWAPKIAPTDHQGVIIRMHDATGTLYDPTFLRFPVREQQRLAQITCEIYVKQGFDGAINIDRESFNFSHPHVVVITKWLHIALRRAIAVQKRIATAALQERRSQASKQTKDEADQFVDETWQSRRGGDGTLPPEIVFTESADSTSETPESFSEDGSADIPPDGDAYLLDRSKVVGSFTGPNAGARRDRAESRIAKITQLLAAYGLLDRLSSNDRADLMAAIQQVLQTYDQ